MIAIKPPDKFSALGFRYLKPIESAVEPAPVDRDTEDRRNRRLRFSNTVFCFIYGAAVIGASWLAAAQSVPVTVVSEPVPEEKTLWNTLNSPEFLAWQQRYQQEETMRLLAEAKQDREVARDYKVIASQKLAASFLPHSPGEDVTTTTEVSVSCFDDGDLGWSASITQMDESSPYVKRGTIANLDECYSGTRGAGSAIGKAGKFQPTVRE